MLGYDDFDMSWLGEVVSGVFFTGYSQ
ncbi:hypothetical protein L195_g044320, partial [Trifolium pratense]